MTIDAKPKVLASANSGKLRALGAATLSAVPAAANVTGARTD